MRRGLTDSVLPWVLPVLLLVLWEIGARSGFISARILPAPERGGARLLDQP